MIYLSETFLDSYSVDSDARLNLKDFTLIRAGNCKRGGANIYFKEHLAVHPVSPLNLNECLVLKINTQHKKVCIIFLHQSYCQSKDKAPHFFVNFEQLLSD